MVSVIDVYAIPFFGTQFFNSEFRFFISASRFFISGFRDFFLGAPYRRRDPIKMYLKCILYVAPEVFFFCSDCDFFLFSAVVAAVTIFSAVIAIFSYFSIVAIFSAAIAIFFCSDCDFFLR